MNVGKNIKRIRKNKGLTQEQVAKLSNVSKNAIYNYENDKRCPDINVLGKIADALGVSTNDILFEDVDSNEHEVLNKKTYDEGYLNKLILNIHDNDKLSKFSIDVITEVCNLLNSDVMQKEFKYSFDDIVNNESYLTLIILSLIGTIDNNIAFIKSSK